MKKSFIALGAAVALLVVFFALNAFIYKEKQGEVPGEPVAPYQGTLSGTQTCLPHKDKTGPQTLECALGIETDAGEYYALDLRGVTEAESLAIQGGKRFTASGTITPIENLSTDQWQKYDVAGIFSITSPVQVSSVPAPSPAPSPAPTPAPVQPGSQARCYVGGCSANICSDSPNVASTCEYREEYACYQTATCERQANGQCGWTDTSALRACIQNAR